ncbi:MAG: HAD-IA family hydrolase [Clostridiaceae bacterium]|nr:HAD-IA family hydrolase [Clostridiaceae bacterium]
MFLHYIWDFDGTLFDSYPHLSLSFQRALKDFGYSHTTNEILLHMKTSINTCIRYYQEKYGLGEELSERYKYYEKNENTIPIKPYPYLREVLKKITETGGKNYIYTHRGKSTIEYIREFKLEDFFCDWITKEDNFPLKPAPDAILHLIKKHNMDKNTVIMVGDRDIDILSGHNAKVSGCLFDPDNFFPDLDVEFRVKSMREFEEVLLKNSS